MRFSPAEFSLPVNGLIEADLDSMELALAPLEVGAASESAPQAAPGKTSKSRGVELENALPASAASSARDPLA